MIGTRLKQDKIKNDREERRKLLILLYGKDNYKLARKLFHDRVEEISNSTLSEEDIEFFGLDPIHYSEFVKENAKTLALMDSKILLEIKNIHNYNKYQKIINEKDLEIIKHNFNNELIDKILDFKFK